MPTPRTDHAPDDDTNLETLKDIIAEGLADEAVEYAVAEYPYASTRFRRMVARLYIKTRLDPGSRNSTTTAKIMRIGRRRLPEIEAAAIGKLRRELRRLHPELF